MSDLVQRVRFRRDHGWAPGQMSAYLDGEMPVPRRRRLERHTTECPECRAVLLGLRHMLTLMGRAHAAVPAGSGAQLATTVRARIRAGTAQESSTRADGSERT
jgi:anti-sigma factor RsiW